MKKTVLAVLAAAITILMLLGNESALAASCKFQDNTEDLFAGVTIVRTKWDRISPNWEKAFEKYIGYVSASTEGEATFLRVRIRYLEKSRFKPTKDELANALVVPEGAELSVVMADKTIVSIPSIGLVEGKNVVHSPYSKTYNSDDYVVVTHADVKYKVDVAAAEALVAQEATMMQMVTSNRQLDVPMHKNSLDGIKNAITCLSSTPE